MKLKNRTLTKQPIVISSTPCEAKPDHTFLRKIVDKGILELKPLIDKAGIIYPEIQEYFKTNNFTTTEYILDSLTREGVLVEKSQERILTCPQCGSPEVHSKFSCPRCNSDAVDLTQLLEHTTCGYIGPRADFSKGDCLICPRCSTDLSKDTVSYRSIGNFYQCEKCENRFDKPEVIHICQNCGKTSTFKEIKYVKVSTYRLSDDVLNDYMSELPSLESMRLYLSSKGFNVKLHSEIAGLSGTLSHFDLIAEKGNARLVVDTSLQGNKSDIIAFLTKKIDVNPTKALLLDISGNNELTALGKIYGIDVCGLDAMGVKGNQIPKEIENLVSDLTNEDKEKISERQEK